MNTYIRNFHQYIFKKNYILQISNLYFIFHFYFSQLNKVRFFLIILIAMTDCTCKITSTCAILRHPYLGLKPLVIVSQD
jgi:hypothetical protein